MKRYCYAAWIPLLTLQLVGCSSNGSGSSGPVTSHSAIYYGSPWYNQPYYYYDNPDYVVVPPDRPLRPERPIGPERPSQLPAERPRAGTLPSTSSRMPSAQPRTSRPSVRPSIPSRPRGGGMSRGGGRRR